MCAGKAAQHFAMTIEREQEVLMNLADMVIEVYTAESAILRAEKLATKNGEDATEYQIAMSKLYLYQAIKNCNQSGEEVILSFAEGDEQRMLLMGLKRFTKGYTINPKEMRRNIAEKQIEENQYFFRNKMTKLKNKTILITGGASGIGKIMSRLSLERMSKVIIWDINTHNIENTLKELNPL